jgi:protein-S-isoprenylcysteine O-methyltransferase Ste14
MTTAAETDTQRAPLGAVLGTIVFVLTLPGAVVVLGPWLISRWAFRPPFLGVEDTRFVGLGLIAAALPVFTQFLVHFVREGHGTPAPVAPTRHLVVGGPYQYVRNPAYIAVVAMLAGQAFLFGNADLLGYAALVGIGFHLFVVWYEEPTLRRTFGEEYEDYCRQVPRWMPRLRAG